MPHLGEPLVEVTHMEGGAQPRKLEEVRGGQPALLGRVRIGVRVRVGVRARARARARARVRVRVRVRGGPLALLEVGDARESRTEAHEEAG